MTPFGCQISLGVARIYGTWHYCLARNGIFSLPWCKNVDFPNPLGCWSACSTGCSNGSLLLSSIPEDTSSLATFTTAKQDEQDFFAVCIHCKFLEAYLIFQSFLPKPTSAPLYLEALHPQVHLEVEQSGLSIHQTRHISLQDCLGAQTLKRNKIDVTEVHGLKQLP